MNEVLGFLKEMWAFIVLVASGIGMYFKWRTSQKKSTDMLYSELEVLKQKIIIQISKEIEHATELSEKNKLLLSLKENCPECYERAIQKINNNEQ